jgi:hypothetical protein
MKKQSSFTARKDEGKGSAKYTSNAGQTLFSGCSIFDPLIHLILSSLIWKTIFLCRELYPPNAQRHLRTPTIALFQNRRIVGNSSNG